MGGPRIAVLGGGANGASIAADLARAGRDVVVIDQWPENVAAIREGGVRIEMPGETLRVPLRAYHLCDVCTFRQRFDVVLVLVKAYDTGWACRLIEPYVSREGLVVGVQNGMTTDAVADVVGPERTLGCVIEISAMMVEPGVVQRHSPSSRSWFAVGSSAPASAGREGELAELLGHAGTVAIVDDIRAAKWMKLVSNCTTLVTSALLGLSIAGAAALPDMRELMLRAGQEALDTGAALGHRVLPIFGLEAGALRRPERVVETLLDTLLAGFALPDTTSTILHDWLKGRHSEADDINGLVVAERARLSGAAPVNAAVVELAHRVERGELTPGADNLALLRRLAG